MLLDAENITYESRKRGYEPDYGCLAQVIHHVCAGADLHAFYSREGRHAHFDPAFETMGWAAHPYTIHTVSTRDGMRKRANSDHNILFLGGFLVCESDADIVLIASGDGDLVSDMAVSLAQARPRMRLATLSVAGSTSQRILCANNRNVTGNALLGRDCLRPLPRDSGYV